MTYEDILDSWVGEKLSRYERVNNHRPLSAIDRPQNQIEYKFNTNVDSFDKRYYCNTWLTVNRSTGRIVNWSYNGDCYMHGYCAKRSS